MWVHPDLMEGHQWTTVTSRESRGKAKALPCNVVCASSREAETDVPSLTNFEETIVLAAEPNAPLVAGTHSGQSYLKSTMSGGKSVQADPRTNQAIHETTREAKGASVRQTSPKRQSEGILNTLPL